jgi:hypothetical protein
MIDPLLPTQSAPVFLKPETKIEPLICGWYAWTHMVSPLQCAMNLAYRSLPLLHSFLKNPRVHINAARDASLYGGPFVCLTEDDIPKVSTLVAEIEQRCDRLLALASDVRRLDSSLQATARGFALHEIHERPPDSLSGLVEFLYDTNHHPRLRFFEELLYDEALNREACEIMLSTLPDTEREFFMSTPRLRSPANLFFRMAFSDPRLDLLASTRTRARPFGDIAESLQVPAEDHQQLARFFTTQPPARNADRYSAEGVRIRYFGHACVLLETRRTAILLDPVLAFDPRPDGRWTIADLPDHIDYVVLSHNHQDHCSPEMLIQLRHRVGRVIVPRNNSGSLADPSMKLMLAHLGIPDVVEVSPLEKVPLADGAITSLPFPGEHSDLDIHSRQGIHIELEGRRFAFLVDSDGRDPDLFRRVACRVNPRLDGFFIGMECHGAPLSWAYGPLLTRPVTRRDDESRRLSGADSERAWNVLQHFSTTRVFVYAMGQEPWLRYFMGLQYTPESVQLREAAAFIDRCRAAGMTAEQLYISRELVL